MMEMIALAQLLLLFGAPLVAGWLLLRASFGPLVLTDAPNEALLAAGAGGRRGRRPWHAISAVILLFAAPALIAILELPAIQDAARRHDRILPLRAVLQPFVHEGVSGRHWKRDLLAREAAGEDLAGAATEVLLEAFDDLAPGETLSFTGTLGVAALACTARSESPPVPDADAAALAGRVLTCCFPKEPLTAELIDRGTLTLLLRATASRDGDLVRVVLLRGAWLNGKEIGRTQPNGDPLPSPLVDDIDLPLDRPETPGAQTLTVDVDLFLYTRFDAERLRDVKGVVRPVEDWPQPLARASQTITIPLRP